MKQFLLACAALVSLSAPALAGDIAVTGDVYSYATAKSQKNGAVFLEISNGTPKDIHLISANTDVSSTTEIHTMSMDDGIMEMRRLEKLTVAAEQSASLEPGGDHIMIMGLHSPLKEGSKFPITLNFDNGQSVSATVSVLAPGAKPAHAHDGHDHSSHGDDHSHHGHH